MRGVAFSYDLPAVLVIEIAIARKRFDGHQSFDKKSANSTKKPKLRGADDERIELFADTVFHEFDFFPLDQFAFGFRRAALGERSVVADFVQRRRIKQRCRSSS